MKPARPWVPEGLRDHSLRLQTQRFFDLRKRRIGHRVRPSPLHGCSSKSRSICDGMGFSKSSAWRQQSLLVQISISKTLIFEDSGADCHRYGSERCLEDATASPRPPCYEGTARSCACKCVHKWRTYMCIHFLLRHQYQGMLPRSAV